MNKAKGPRKNGTADYELRKLVLRWAASPRWRALMAEDIACGNHEPALAAFLEHCFPNRRRNGCAYDSIRIEKWLAAMTASEVVAVLWDTNSRRLAKIHDKKGVPA